MTCADIERLVDAFADAELPTSTMVAVARSGLRFDVGASIAKVQ